MLQTLDRAQLDTVTAASKRLRDIHQRLAELGGAATLDVGVADSIPNWVHGFRAINGAG